jgi:hypothetical protein
VAEALQLSVDRLYAESGRARADEKAPAPGVSPVEEAIRADPALSGAQRRALLEVYAAFTRRSGAGDEPR